MSQSGSTVLNLITGPARPDFAPLPIRGDQSPEAVYVHVPFCTTKCHYCDFYSLAGHLGEADRFLDALEREIAIQTAQMGRPTPQTVFIGGGTPTLMSADQLERLLTILSAAMDPRRIVEFTVEGNPNTFSPDRARVLKRHGVNRMSFGAQSFVKSELEQLQRDHEPENVSPAVQMAREAGIDNVNIDLIFGIPRQTEKTWAYSLGRALEIGTEHLSCYSLIYEPNTAMTARLKRGEVTPIDEELELKLFEQTYSTLRAAGFSRYEVSNYAKPGKECRHNLHYWKGSEYFAWGPAAAAHVAGHRWKNVQSLAHYSDALLANPPTLPLTQMEKLDPMKRAGEIAMLQLRLAAGLDWEDFQKRTGVDARKRLDRVIRKYDGLDLLEISAKKIALTEKAVAVSNTIVADVMAAFD
jgi:oxygen-independent coproporphyrinogen-3 oxidase